MSYTMDDRDRIQGHGRDDGDMHRGGERWVVGEGESKTFDLDGVERLKVSLLKGRIDVIGHDDESCRLEITKVKGSPVNVSFDGRRLVIANDDKVSNGVLSFLGIHVSFGGVPRTMTARADVSLLVPRDVAAKISTISGDALISGLTCGAKLDTVSGTLLSDGVSGALNMDTVSGKVEARNHHGSVRAKTVGGDVVVQIVKITHMLPSRDAWAPLGFLCRHYNTPRAKCKAPIHRGRLHKHCRRAQKNFLPQIAGFSLQAAKMLL